jgi:enoyl-CoA hydratase
MENEKILLNIEDHIATITMNRPERHNALDGDAWTGLQRCISEIESNDDVRVVVIKGAGGKAFSSGLDISMQNEQIQSSFKESKDRSRQSVMKEIVDFQNVFNSIEWLPVPVIACMQGMAIGGGIEIALACDIRLASDNATFRFPMNHLGFIADQGGTTRLSRLVGIAKAKELFFTGWEIDAKEALSIGLINNVYKTEDLPVKTETMAQRIAEAAPLAVQATKRTISMGWDMAIKDSLKLEVIENVSILASDDLTEGIMSFIEKRKPVFKGR